MKQCTHFVGFSGEEYHSATRVWGEPDFIHRGWDSRAQREIAEGDVVVFAKDTEADEFPKRTFNDIDEKWLR